MGSTRCTPHDGEGRPTLLNLHCSASYPTHWKVVAFHFYLLNFVCVWASTYTCLRLQNICAVASLPVWSTVTRATSLRNICGSLCEETVFFSFLFKTWMSGISVRNTIIYRYAIYTNANDIYIYMQIREFEVASIDRVIWQILQNIVSLACLLMSSCEHSCKRQYFL